MFDNSIVSLAQEIVATAKSRSLRIVTAESCTGGLVAGALTEISGSSDVFGRGYVTYSNRAKQDLLGVSADHLNRYGAVSEQVAKAMAEGALRSSGAHIAIAVTGIAGPTGGSNDKPVGLVHIAAARTGRETIHAKHLFGDIGRSAVRMKSVEAALTLLKGLL